MEANKFFELYCEVIEKIIDSCADCKYFIKNQETEKLLEELNKRHSLIDIFLTLSQKLDKSIDSKPELHANVKFLLGKINDSDEEILNYLSGEKEKTQVEIAQTFKVKERIKGYNLNSTK